jgi:hypothetical protein
MVGRGKDLPSALQHQQRIDADVEPRRLDTHHAG